MTANKNPLSNIDPKLEEKVDRMMNGSDKSSGPAGAPLLPDDKLPDFDKKSEVDKPLVAPPAKPPETLKTDKKEPQPKKPERQSDVATDKAVDEIVEEESDRMLAIEDAKAELLAEGAAEIDKGFGSRVKEKLAAFWHNRAARNGTFAVVLAAILIAGVVPTSRYFMLNSLGVRASMSLRVIDDKTEQPLKNVEVYIDGKSAKTDIEGKVRLSGIKLGRERVTAKKPAFAELNQEMVIGWGSNPRGDIGLTAVGSRYTFKIKDYVSGNPVVSAEAVSGEASATANQNGEIVLVVADQGEEKINVQINAKDYRADSLDLEVGDNEAHQISLVPAKKHAFVSKRSGKYDLYKTDVDGKNQELVLHGTGSEQEDSTAIMPSRTDNTIAYVTTRGDRHNEDGFALSSLLVVNLDNNDSKTIDYSERIQPIDFIGGRLVYAKIAEGQSGSSPSRHQLISYDITTGQKKVLAKANYFNDVLSAEGAIYYAPSQYKPKAKSGLYKINPDGSDRHTIYASEVWNLFRVDYGKIDAAVGSNWYGYDIDSGIFSPLGEAPAQNKSRIYIDGFDDKKSVWIDKRDGKGVLIIYDKATGQEKVLHTQGGLTYPVSWLDGDHLVYRLATASETADYVISLSGGAPKKIVDVTDTAGLDRWYYY